MNSYSRAYLPHMVWLNVDDWIKYTLIIPICISVALSIALWLLFGRMRVTYMPSIHFEKDGVKLSLYGDVHVSTTLEGETVVDIRGCKVNRIFPPGIVSLAQLASRRIVSIFSNEQVGGVYYRHPELAVGEEDPTEYIQVPRTSRLKIKMPVDPD